LAGTTANVKNNIFYQTGDINEVGTITADYNCWYDCYTTKSGANDVTSDPLFENAGADDYRLSSGSPCIDEGTDLGFDYTGTAPDMGAFEYSALIASDSVSIGESVSTLMSDLEIVVQDTVSVSESAIFTIGGGVYAQDQISLSESVNINITGAFYDVDDNIVVSEFVELLLSGAGEGAVIVTRGEARIMGAEVRVNG
jgi:hypothetical protein